MTLNAHIETCLTLATHSVDLLEQVLVLAHGDPDPHGVDPHPDALQSLLFATDALTFAVARYRIYAGHAGRPAANDDHEIPW